jgi:predicted metal-dependent peptidase
VYQVAISLQPREKTMDKIEKTISELLVLLIQSDRRFVKAMGYRLAVMPRIFTTTVTETMAVDGVTLFINPVWSAQQTKLKLLFVLLHEACHVWMLHSKRLRNVYPHLRNIVHKAADYAVNLTLAQAGAPYPVPEDALIDYDFVDQDQKCLNVERIVELLMQQQKDESSESSNQQNTSNNSPDSGDPDSADSQDSTEPVEISTAVDDSGDDSTDSDTDAGSADSEDGNGDDSGDGDSGNDDSNGAGVEPNSQDSGCNDLTPDSCGDLLPAPDDLDEKDHVKRNEQALQLAANGAGAMPANMMDELHLQAQGSDTDWLSIFRDRFATAMDASDYSFKRFSEPYAAIGMIEPTLYSEAVGSIAIVVDESSSMDNDALNKATEQIAAIIAEWTPQRVLVIRHTTDIVDVQDLTYGQEPEPREKRAHGGTYFNPVIDMLEEENVEVACWVTDCYPCDDKVRETQVPTIWLGTEYGSESAHGRYNLQGDYVAIGDM